MPISAAAVSAAFASAGGVAARSASTSGFERGSEGDAERVLGGQARARERAVEVEADVLGVVGNQRLDRVEEFHRSVLRRSG